MMACWLTWLALAAPGAVERFALVVGQNQPEDASLPTLKYADDDALATAALMSKAGATVTLLTALDADTLAAHPGVKPQGLPTPKALELALVEMYHTISTAHQRGASTVFYFFYSGHGSVEHGEGYVVLAGGRLTRHELLTHVVGRSPADTNHIMVDACRSYFMAFERGTAQRSPAPKGFSHMDVSLARTGFILSTSSDRESHEWEQFRAGVFSHQVLSGLWGGADANLDAGVTYAELQAFVATANLGVANEAYRPDFLIMPPGRSAVGDDEPVLEIPWGDDLILDLPQAGHVYVEDGHGKRWMDVHASTGQMLRLRTPPQRPLFVRSQNAHSEWTMPGLGVESLSGLEVHPQPNAAKGAVELALVQLFTAPFGQSQVDAWVTRERVRVAAQSQATTPLPPLEGDAPVPTGPSAGPLQLQPPHGPEQPRASTASPNALRLALGFTGVALWLAAPLEFLWSAASVGVAPVLLFWGGLGGFYGPHVGRLVYWTYGLAVAGALAGALLGLMGLGAGSALVTAALWLQGRGRE